MSARCSWRRELVQLSSVNDGVCTATTEEQERVEKEVSRLYREVRDRLSPADRLYLMRSKHVMYIKHGIRKLSSNFECLDASRPWMCYWMLHSMLLMRHPISDDLATDVIKFLKKCQHPDGGFGGGPGQLPHVAPTYAAVLALCTLGTEEAYRAIDRSGLQCFLLRMHQPNGSFIMHDDGETDIRGAYCALVSALLTNVATSEIFHNTGEWISSCQTYEGGFSALPGTEAHGGYTFCGFAASLLLNKISLCNVQHLLRWAVNRQMKLEGGFQGRTNKLVDGCYSFWVGGLFPLLYLYLKQQNNSALHHRLWLFHQEALQEYVLFCCQSPYGGLVDKPGKCRDFYHTCYCLSGLSVAQHCFDGNISDITGERESILEAVHPVFNIVNSKADDALDYFKALPKCTFVYD